MPFSLFVLAQVGVEIFLVAALYVFEKNIAPSSTSFSLH